MEKSVKNVFMAISSVAMLGLMAICMCLIMKSCTTITISQAHTEGQASDVIDSTQDPSNQATVNPNINIPLK